MNKKRSTRDKILDTIFALVYIHGYNGTSMSMVLKECGIPKGSLYHCFDSKKEMILAVLKERISLKVDDLYDFKRVDNEHEIDTIVSNILKISQKDMFIMNGCPLNKLNQEISCIDKDFEFEINLVFEKIKNKIKLLLDNTTFNKNINTDSLSEYIITTIQGSLSLSKNQSSKHRYLQSISHLVSYLKSLKR